MIASTQTNHPIVLPSESHKSATPIELACAKLKAAGLRITRPRIAILSSLIKRIIPASIEQIHGDLPADTCDLVTVYRCLGAFQDIGLVRLSYFHNGASAYQITLTDDLPPYHVISKKDNAVQELDADSTAELREVITRIEEKLRAQGHSKISHIVEFFVADGATESDDGMTIERGTMSIPAALEMRSSSTSAVPMV